MIIHLFYQVTYYYQILSANGKVFSKGKQQETLGRDINTNNPEYFTQVFFKDDSDDGVEGRAIYNISAGTNHVLALDEKYCVWAWGLNKHLQVNPKAKDVTHVLLPKRIEFVTCFLI